MLHKKYRFLKFISKNVNSLSKYKVDFSSIIKNPRSCFSRKMLFSVFVFLPVVGFATDFGSSGCTVGSATSCVGGSYSTSKGLSLGDTLDTTPDKKILFSSELEPNATITLNAAKAIVEANQNKFILTSGSSINLKFKDSVWKGDFSDTPKGTGSTTSNSTLALEGSYQGASESDLKGYAWVGDINISHKTTITFSNNAKMRGNIINNGDLTLSFSESNLEGSISGSGKQNLTIDSSSVGNITGGSRASVVTFKNSKSISDLKIGNIDFSGRLTGTIKNVTIGNINNANSSTNLTLDGVSQADQKNNVIKIDDKDAILTFKNTDKKNLKLGSIDSHAKLEGTISNTTLENINNYNNANSDLIIQRSKVSSIKDVKKISIWNSDVFQISNENKDSTLVFGTMKDKTIGNVDFAGTVSEYTNTSGVASHFENSRIEIMKLKGSGNAMGLDSKSSIKSLHILGGDTTIAFDNESSLGELKINKDAKANLTFSKQSFLDNISNDGGALDLKFSTSSYLGKNIFINGGTSNISFDTSFDWGDEIQVQSGTLNLSFKASVSSITPPASGVPLQTTKNHFSESKVSFYAGEIKTLGGENNIDFFDSLYLGNKIIAKGGITNTTISFSDDFVDFLKKDAFSKNLFGAKGLSLSLTTDAQNAINNLALRGKIKATITIDYLQGESNIVFVNSFDPKTDGPDVFKGGDSTDFNSKDSYEAMDSSKKNVKINGYTSKDGLIVRLKAVEVNNRLVPYRDIFPANRAVFQTNSQDDVYHINISGVVGGELNSFSSSGSKKSYQVLLENGSAFLGTLHMNDNNVSLALSDKSKLIIDNDSNIANLLGFKKSSLNTQDILGDSLSLDNIVIDLATRGIRVVDFSSKSEYSKLTIGNVKDLDNAIFRVSYDPNAQTSVPQKNKNDYLVIQGASRSDSTLPLRGYLQAFQNVDSVVLGDLSDKNILVASIKDDSSGNEAMVFDTTSQVQEGYDILTTTFKKKKNGTNTDYYIESAQAQVAQDAKATTEAAITTNYSIFLGNINDINKRLGEVRDNPDTQGVWARVFNAMSTSIRGDEVRQYSTNVQGGYDFSLFNPSGSGKSLLGVAFSYGYNILNADSFKGRANLVEVGMYYSYVGNKGFYSDSILKYAFIDNSLSLKANQAQEAKLTTSAFSFGEELGYRWYFTLRKNQFSKHSLYLEPSVEGILGYLGKGNLMQDKGELFLNSAIDSILVFRGRVGGVLGYSFKTSKNQTDFRVGLSYIGDIVGGGKIDYKTNFSNAQGLVHSNQMGLLSIGINSVLSKKWRVYADVDTSFGGKYYNQNYLISVGARYSFGKKRFSKKETSYKSEKDQSLFSE